MVLEDADNRASKPSWGPEDVERETLINSPGVQKPTGAQGDEATDCLGLTTVYRHPNGGPVKLDIIFVHDIHGGSHSSWMTSWMGPAQEEVFWPSALLPLREPRGVPKSIWPLSLRIKTYGYQRWRPSNNGYNIPALGSELLSVLLSCDDLTQSTSSIILVCEAFGGLVVKSALSSLTQHQQDHKMFESRIASVVFFETIHWPKSREQNASLDIYDSYESDPRVQLALKSPGNWAPDDDRQFQTRMLPFDIFSLFLADDSRLAEFGGGVAMGLINETPIQLSTGFTLLTGRRSINRNVYATIFDCIAQTAYRLSYRIQVTDSITWRDADERTQLVADYLKMASDRYPGYQLQALEKRLAPGTFQWLLEEEDFCYWRDAHPGRQILWITGPAGWGKTHLAAFAVRHLHAKDCGDAHVYFFPFDDDRLQSPQACLLSFAYQRSLVNPAFQHALIRLKTTVGALDGLETEALSQKLLDAGILDDAGHRIFFVLDGLDTCHNPNVLLDTLISWCGLSSLRLLIISHIVESAIVPGAVMLPLQPKHARFDVGAILGNYAQFVSESAGQSLTALIRRLTQRNLTRTALWASLVVDKLNECHTDVEFSHAILSLPESAEVFYEEATSSVEADGTRPLKVVLGSVALLRYPIRLQSLLKGLSQSYPFDPTTDPLFPAFHGLLKVDVQGQLRFRHRLARDVYIGAGGERSYRTTELDLIHMTLLFCANLHMKGSTESSQVRGLIQRPTQLARFPMYMFTNFTWHLVRLNTNHKHMLPIAHAFLKYNMVSWIMFLSNAGAHVLRQASEDLLKYCEKFSDSFELSPAEEASLDFILTFLETGPHHIDTRGARHEREICELARHQRAERQRRQDTRAKAVPGESSDGRRTVQVEHVKPTAKAPVRSARSAYPPRHWDDELGELQKTSLRR